MSYTLFVEAALGSGAYVQLYLVPNEVIGDGDGLKCMYELDMASADCEFPPERALAWYRGLPKQQYENRAFPDGVHITRVVHVTTQDPIY